MWQALASSWNVFALLCFDLAWDLASHAYLSQENNRGIFCLVLSVLKRVGMVEKENMVERRGMNEICDFLASDAFIFARTKCVFFSPAFPGASVSEALDSMVPSRFTSGTKTRKEKCAPDREPKEDAAHSGDIHVLAVDDCLIDRKVIERLLKTNSFKVTTVDSAARALEVLGINEEQATCACNNAFKVNMIITDYCMPGMTGYDLLKKVKETKGLKEIPVVIMSSENVPQRVTSCLAEGAEDFIIKPVKVADIMKLKGHLKPPKAVASASTSSPANTKRKISSGKARGKMSERRPRVSGLTFA
eukprot:Gb_33947 [translate_table: standard]